MSSETLRRARSASLFLGGLAGIAYETLAQDAERPTLLILFAAMVGLPAFINADERRKKDGDEKKNGEAPA